MARLNSANWVLQKATTFSTWGSIRVASRYFKL